MKVHTDLETSLFIETEFNCVLGGLELYANQLVFSLWCSPAT